MSMSAMNLSAMNEETLREMIEELDRLVCMLSEEEKAVVEEARKEMFL